MKKLLAFILCVTMVFSLSACSGNQNEKQNNDSPDAGSSNGNDTQAGDETSQGGNIEVNKNLFDVELTIPADFIGEGVTQEMLESGISDNDGIKSVVLNEDGSATYTMTKAAHEEMVNGIKDSIDEALADMINDPDYSFIEIEHNNDYTKFTVKIDAEELGLADSFSVLAFYMYGGMYAAFSGNTADNIQVDFVNATTGEIIETANSSEMS